jgi:hypothetical protein
VAHDVWYLMSVGLIVLTAVLVLAVYMLLGLSP